MATTSYHPLLWLACCMKWNWSTATHDIWDWKDAHLIAHLPHQKQVKRKKPSAIAKEVKLSKNTWQNQHFASANLEISRIRGLTNSDQRVTSKSRPMAQKVDGFRCQWDLYVQGVLNDAGAPWCAALCWMARAQKSCTANSSYPVGPRFDWILLNPTELDKQSQWNPRNLQGNIPMKWSKIPQKKTWKSYGNPREIHRETDLSCFQDGLQDLRLVHLAPKLLKEP